MLDYLPEVSEIRKIPKQWIINLIYSLTGNKFKNWVRERIESRNTRITDDRDLMISLDPKIAAAFA